MTINRKRFRLSVYQDHKVTGTLPKRSISLVRYRSADNGGKQRNYALTLGLTTWHLKLKDTP